MKNTILKYYAFLPLLLLCSFYVYKAIDFPIHDFANYYFGGKFLAEGNFNFKIYFPYEFNNAISNLDYRNVFANYAPNTPFLAFLFLPFSFVTVGIAKIIFNCFSIGLFVFSIYRLFAYYKINPKFALLIPVLFLVPIKNNLLFGQVYFLLFFLLSEGWLAYQKERWKSMAFFWSLSILLKVFPVLLLLFLLFKKQWRPLFCLIVSCILLFGISLIFTGLDIWIFYLKEVLPKASNGVIATAFVPNYQSVFMFLKELLVFDATDNPQSIFNYPDLFSAIMLAFKIGILGIGYFISKRTSNALFVLSYWILAMILLSPYGSTYTFVLLLFPLLALLKSDVSNVKKVLCFLLLLLIGNLPLSFFITNNFPFSYLRLFLLLLFFGLLLIQFRQKINWKILAAICFVPMILVLVFKKDGVVKSTILLKDGPILIYDYNMKNDTLFADCKEKNIFRVSEQAVMPFKFKTNKPLNLKNNQVFYNNRQLTFDKSNKLKPILIDNEAILYLSDYDRGIGFYTLRIIELH